MLKKIRETKWYIILLYLIAGPILLILEFLVLAKFKIFSNIYKLTNGLVNFTLLIYLILIFTIIFGLFIGLGKLRLKDLGVRIDKIKNSILFTVLFWIIINIITAICLLIVSGSIALNRSWGEKGALALLGLLLCQLFGNALYEEIAFRGFLFPQIYLKIKKISRLNKKNKIIISIILSQAYFSIMHIPNRLYHNINGIELLIHLIMVFIIGIVFVLLYLRTNNLFIVIGIHALADAPTLIFASPFNENIIPGILPIIILIFWPRIDSFFKLFIKTKK